MTHSPPESSSQSSSEISRSSLTSITHSEIPVTCTEPLSVEPLSTGPLSAQPQSGLPQSAALPQSGDEPMRPSWADPPGDPVEEPTTDPLPRITSLRPPSPVLDQKNCHLLLRMDGIHAGEVISLDRKELSLGRHPSNHLVIEDSGISRYHAKLLLRDEQVEFIDLGSRNGSFIQGQLAQRATLQDGDFIQLGARVSFRYCLTDSKQEKLLHRLYESSNRDSLTRAYNRKHFDERLSSEVAYALRHRSTSGLLLFDIDHFKRVNDEFGHAAGDAVLRQVAGIVQNRLRTEDVFARIGGEEFAILLRGVHLSGCQRLAERLRTQISTSPCHFGSSNIGISISVGCATLECLQHPQAKQLLQLADQRLYQAKAGGRNRVVAQ